MIIFKPQNNREKDVSPTIDNEEMEETRDILFPAGEK